MTNSIANSAQVSANNLTLDTSKILINFQQEVIDRFNLTINNQNCNYAKYLAVDKIFRSNDEANAIDQQFTRYLLEWLDYNATDWDYNVPQSGQKANRPDYTVRGSVGVAFICEDKNSTIDFDDAQHLLQMRRYTVGTAGYAVWCNMRRIFALRFLAGETLKYNLLADISVEALFYTQNLTDEQHNSQLNQLALFRLLFGKERFTRFGDLTNAIAISEQDFENQAIPLNAKQATRNFITGSRQSLDHLRLAALAQIQEALDKRESSEEEITKLQQEWADARNEIAGKINQLYRGPIVEAIDKLTPRLGNMDLHEIRQVWKVVEQVGVQGIGKITGALRSVYEKWLEDAVRINSALLSLRFQSAAPDRIAEAYRVWSERQSDQEDVKPNVFAEQVAYVFFVRLLLVRVLEDKSILQPRIASDGGFTEWFNYVKKHFQELNGAGILNEDFSNILTRKASHYYFHFFQQPVFDWFNPDDFLLVETLEFLTRYNFRDVASDIIGFTYEEYIDRNARNRKGHFLTRNEVVDYMLDLLDYNNPTIIDQPILDPACGSGSFLVHAARRYRQTLITSICYLHNLSDSEDSIKANPNLQRELARKYLDALSKLFFGMELNPFACYLAEMNLLIQGLDDLHVLQQYNEFHPIDRFQIFNTDSLDMPNEVLESSNLTPTLNIPDRLSSRLVDEAFPIKARIEDFAAGFQYIISNPPYVTSKHGSLDSSVFKNSEFYKSVLSGDTNLYLLFLRLGLYYLAEGGQMVYIVPLTIFGDSSASAARKLFTTPPFSPSVAVRFYRGDILFPGVDQAVGIVRVNHSHENAKMFVSGGAEIKDARAAQFETETTKVVQAVPSNGNWQGVWLVSSDDVTLDIWQQAKSVSNNLSYKLGDLLNTAFDIKQGDVNATYINPLRIGNNNGSFANPTNVAIYKGENVQPFAPLPLTPSDWIDFNKSSNITATITAAKILQKVKQITNDEMGIILREVARLNTRERLNGSWFVRTSNTPIAFTHELWRMALKLESDEHDGKALLALLNSRVVAFLYNLFSTNNHVSKDELSRLPIPEPTTLPKDKLADLADKLLQERAKLANNFVLKYQAELPEFDDGKAYVPPSGVLAAIPTTPKLTIQTLLAQGQISNTGNSSGRIKALHTHQQIKYSGNNPKFEQVLDLFLSEPSKQEQTWTEAQSWQLPNPNAAGNWLTNYQNIVQQAQSSWENFVQLQREVDNVVADWYGFNATMRKTIAEGLPWARRQRLTTTQTASPTIVPKGITNRVLVTSSQIYTIGYDSFSQILEIEFPNGDVFQYQAVPTELYQNFEATSSKGGFYNKNIKGKFTSIKL